MNADSRQTESPRYRSILRSSASSGEKRPVENESHRSDSGDEVPLRRNKRVRFDLDNSRQGQEPLRFIPSRPDEGECDESEVLEMSDVSDLGESDQDSSSIPPTPAAEPTTCSSAVDEVMPHEQRDDDEKSDGGESYRDSSSVSSTPATEPTTCSSVVEKREDDGKSDDGESNRASSSIPSTSSTATTCSSVVEIDNVMSDGESNRDSCSIPSTLATEPTVCSRVVEEVMPGEQRDDDGQSDDVESNRDSSSIPSTPAIEPTICSSVLEKREGDGMSDGESNRDSSSIPSTSSTAATTCSSVEKIMPHEQREDNGMSDGESNRASSSIPSISSTATTCSSVVKKRDDDGKSDGGESNRASSSIPSTSSTTTTSSSVVEKREDDGKSDDGESNRDSSSIPPTPATEPKTCSSVVEKRDDDGKSDDGESNRDSNSIPSTSLTATACSSVEKLMKPDCSETLLLELAIPAQEMQRRLNILDELFDIGDRDWCNGDDASSEIRQLTKLFYKRDQNSSPGVLYTHKLMLGGMKNRVEDFVLLASPPGFIVKTRITRVKKGIAGKFYPIYYMHLCMETLEDTKYLIMIAKKETTLFGGGTGYIISTNPNDLSIDSESCVGKISSNFFGTEFILRSGPSTQDREPKSKRFKEELLKVVYKTNIFGIKSPRKSKVIIPKMRNLQREIVRLSDINVDPPWNMDRHSYILDFSKISKTSLKNFEIVSQDMEGDEHPLLQFERASENSFKLDFQYPFCPLQAFALALTSFD